ncbi:MAG: cytochrome c [Bacteroidia bacterium]|nr:cytochrome c [Bacteroidia bacterium]
MKKIVFASVFFVLTGCFSAKLIPPTQGDVERVQSKFPNYSLAELSEGKTLYEQHCRSCHGLKKPSARTEEKWGEIVPKMAVKANKKYPDSLNADSQEKILKYLITMSSAPRAK